MKKSSRHKKLHGKKYTLTFRQHTRALSGYFRLTTLHRDCTEREAATSTSKVCTLLGMDLKSLVIVGAGGFGREVAWLVNDINKACPTWAIRGFVDSRSELHGETIGGYPVLGGLDSLEKIAASSDEKVHVVIAIGTSSARRKIARSLETLDITYATLVHPSVLMETSAPMQVRIGAGSIICANCVLTVDVRVGDHVIINLACTIGHDAVVSDFSTLLPIANISGFSTLGESVFVGTGSEVLEGRSIGEGSIVGAGCVVVKDLPANCTAVGAPARPIKFHERQWNDTEGKL